MMDVDDLLRKLLDEIRGEHLHVAGQNDQFDLVFAEQVELLVFRFRFVLLGHRDDVIGNVIKISVVPGIRVIADHQRDLAGEFPDALPVEQINEAVIVFGNKDGYAGAIV